MSEWKIREKFNLPKEWEIYRLKELTNQIVDGTHFTPKYIDNGIPFLRVTDIQSKDIDFRGLKFISKKEHELLILRCFPKKGDILISKNGSIGIVKIVDWDWEFSIFVSLALIKIKNKIHSQYLKYLLQSEIVWWQIKSRAKQGTVTNLHLEEIRELEVPRPKLYDQILIAKILDTTDSVIEKTEAAIMKYKAIKQGMLQDLFTRGIDIKTGRLRPKYEDAPGLYKESRLGWIPKEWEDLPVKNILDPIMSNVDKSIKSDEIKVLLCNYMDVYCNRYLTSDITFSSGSVNGSEHQKFLLQPQDVIITKDSETPDDIAVPSVLIHEIENIICGYHLCILRSKNLRKLNGEFLMLQLQLDDINKQFANRANGSTRYGLTIDAIKNVVIKIPKKIDEQLEIAKRLKTIDDKIQSEQAYLKKLQSIKQGLMDDLLSGKNKVKTETLN